tara:strand:- start:35 stop:550 length:516 start_codon:yes stop_codon:yes gene_type:complete
MKQAALKFIDETPRTFVPKISTENNEKRYLLGIGGECLVASKLSFMGFEVLKAIRDCTKQDLFIRYKNKCFGVQVKTSQRRADQKNKNKDVWSFDFRLKETIKGLQKSSKETYNKDEVLIFACVCAENEKVIFIENELGNQMQYKFVHEDFDFITNKTSLETLTKIFEKNK